jgi:DNA-binding IclR family transcriptional regulator
MPNDQSGGVPAADRTLTVLETLAANPQGVSTAELLEMVGGSRSGLYSLVNTLKARGYVVTDAGRHRLGPALWSLLPERPQDLETLLTAFNEELEAVEESVALSWPRPGGTVVVAERQPDRPVRAVYRQGAVRSSHSPDARVIAAGGPGNDPELALIRRQSAASATNDELHEPAFRHRGPTRRPSPASTATYGAWPPGSPTAWELLLISHTDGRPPIRWDPSAI